MNISINTDQSTQIQIVNSLDTTREFGLFLNKLTSSIKMAHWYTQDYNIHKILGKLYDNLNNLFDKMQDEIIGTSKTSNVFFPKLNLIVDNIESLENYQDDQKIINVFDQIKMTLKNLLCSLEFIQYVDSVQSGINNTKEEIISELNKTEYLLSMIKL
jgi:DNA-binding ferritin-like protein